MRKKVADLSPEEQEARRAYDREAKRKSREKLQIARMPTTSEWFDAFPIKHPEQAKALEAYVNEISNRVASELGVEKLSDLSQERFVVEYAVDTVAHTLLAIQKGWLKQVHSPDGVLAGGLHFPDAIGSGLVEAVHRYGLEKSPTFSKLYRELLPMLDERFGDQETEDALAIRAELDGVYVLRPRPQPESERKPQPKPEPLVPSDSAILEQGRIQLSSRLQTQDPNLSPEARRFLNGY